MPARPLALCLEQTLGHRTHGQNLTAAANGWRERVDVVPVPFEPRRLPAPWALRGSARAARRLLARAAPRAALFHTQTISLFAPAAMRGRPYLVSVDATPVQIDAMGRWYAHDRQLDGIEAAKRRWYGAVLRRAAGVVSWSRWAADSLTDDYGVAPERITIAHPGAPAPLFALPRGEGAGKPRILFVGGDFTRKGGDTLLTAFAPLANRAELDVVSGAAVPERPGVRVHTGIDAGSDAHIRAFAEADIFCLPTLGDCTPLVLGEAMAAGLPVVTTRLGSNAEVVEDGVTGFLVPPGDDDALAEALRTLVDDRNLRERMGTAARTFAHEHLDATQNAERVLALLSEVAA